VNSRGDGTSHPLNRTAAINNIYAKRQTTGYATGFRLGDLGDLTGGLVEPFRGGGELEVFLGHGSDCECGRRLSGGGGRSFAVAVPRRDKTAELLIAGIQGRETGLQIQ
jgi:hypothetical protein